MESRRRSIVKAVTWRLVAAFITGLVVYLFTEQAVLSVGIGFADSLVKIFIYYGPERLWDKVDFGRKERVGKDYTI